MHTDQYGQQIRTESELVDYIMTGHELGTQCWLVDSSIDLSNIRYLVDHFPQVVQARSLDISVSEFDKQNQQQWLMPDHYKNLDIVQYVLDLCNTDSELQRCGAELLLYAERDWLDLLRYLVYLVDTMRQHKIVWGVGRGSSVASYVLFKIGVHKIDSMYYDLDISEFLR